MTRCMIVLHHIFFNYLATFLPNAIHVVLEASATASGLISAPAGVATVSNNDQTPSHEWGAGLFCVGVKGLTN